MNSLKKSWALALGLVAATTGAWAQDALTFEEAAKIALDQNITLRQQQNSLLSAEADVMQRSGAYTPSVSAGLGGNYTVGLQFNQLTGELTSRPNEGIGADISLNYTLFDGFARQSLFQQAKSQLAQQRALTARSEELVLFNLASQYLQVLLDQELLTISERNLAEQEENYQVISAQVEAGIRPISDQYDTEANIKNLEIEVLQRKNTLANDEAQLMQTLQLEPGQALVLQKPTWNVETLLNQPVNLEAKYEDALANRADYMAQRLGIDAAVQGVKFAQSGYLPTLSVSGTASTGYTSQFEQFDTVQQDFFVVPFNDQLQRNVQTQARFGLSIPIYSQMRNRAAVQRAQVSRNNEELTLENLQRTIYTEVQQACLNFETFQQALTAAQAQLKASEQAFQIQKERFELGNVDLLTYNQSNTNLVRSRGELVSAEYRLMFQGLLLDFFVGSLDVDSFR